jgi:hypothetical protein
MIYFAGDVNLTDWHFNVGFGIGTKVSKGLNPFKYINRVDDDIWVGNFEGVASYISDNQGFYANSFRVEPKALIHLHHMDYYGFANNHAMEHGRDAYKETIKSLKSYGSVVFGSDDRRSCDFSYKNRIISLTGVCLRIEESSFKPLYWHNPEYIEIEKELSALPSEAFKVLFVHWGNEYINRPSAAQKKFAHWLIDAGFDLIIGMHPHVLQGYEDYKGKRIYYSLGNFVFDMPSEQCKIGAIVSLDFFEGRAQYNNQYVKIDNNCCPHVVDESEISSVWHFSYLNECLKKDDNSENYHNEIKKGYNLYRRANHRQLLKTALTHPVSFMGILRDFVRRKVIKK